MMAWTPYAAISMMSAFGYAHIVPEFVFTSLAFFAKTSFVFNSAVYCFSNRQFR